MKTLPAAFAALVFALSILSAVPLDAKRAALAIDEIQKLIDGGDFPAALNALDDLLKRSPSDPDALFLRSTARIMAGDLAGGRSDLEQSLAIDAERRDAWINRAALDLAEADYQGALQAFLRAEALDPNAADNSLNIGAVLLLSGDRDGASERFRRYLEINEDDPAAFYLVATNYAMAGRNELAIPLLKRSIALDERSRLRARTDANFASLVDDPQFQEILNTDTYQQPANAPTATKTFDIPFEGRSSRVLDATLTALQLAGAPLSAGVEVTPEWALIWSDVRIKIAASEETKTSVTVTARPGEYSPDAWAAKTSELFRQISLQLHSRRRATP